MSSQALNTAAPFEVAGYRIEPSTLRVIRSGEHARLESKAMRVLVYLVEHAGRVVSRGELEAQLWPGRIVTEDAVTNAIAKLRRVLGDDARHPCVIETIPKIGYRLIARVTPISEVDEQGVAPSIPTRHTEPKVRRPSVFWITGVFIVLLLLVTA